jgi:hypothetical protein
VEFRAEQQRLERLHQAEGQGQVAIYYFDASGFSLTPMVPYAWQPRRQTRCLPSASGPRLNVLGFLSKANDTFFYPVEERVRSAEVIAAFDAFAAQTQQAMLRLVIVDNAPMHHSHAFQTRLDQWLAQGVAVHYLPPYSPELNLIEILWRKIKYEWLPFTAYLSFDALKSAVADVLNKVGSKYQITFV